MPCLLWWQVTLDPSRVMLRGSEQVELKTLATIMHELGHTWLDIFKVDVEGAEWDALQGLLAAQAPLPFTQMQVFPSDVPRPVQAVLLRPCSWRRPVVICRWSTTSTRHPIPRKWCQGQGCTS